MPVESSYRRESQPFFSTVLAPPQAPRGKFLVGLALASLVAALSAAQSARIGDAGSLLAVVVGAALCFLVFRLWRDRRSSLSEHICVDHRAIRISRYAANRLVEQRRLKLGDLAIEFTEDGDGGRSVILLRGRTRAAGRTIEIAQDLDAKERRQFFERFLESLRNAGATPQIRITRAAR
jgi:hypothetical protein